MYIYMAFSDVLELAEAAFRQNVVHLQYFLVKNNRLQTVYSVYFVCNQFFIFPV